MTRSEKSNLDSREFWHEIEHNFWLSQNKVRILRSKILDIQGSGDLISATGNSGPASDTLTVALAVPTLGLWWMLILGGSILLVALRQLVIRA